MKNLLNQIIGCVAQQCLDKQQYGALKVSGITATITMLISASVTSSYASDIEVYVAPSAGASAATVVMMLDTSGSMDANTINTGNYGSNTRSLIDAACDIPTGFTYGSVVAGENHPDGRGYTRNYCSITQKSYFYKKVSPFFSSTTTWYECSTNATSQSSCTTLMAKAPNVSGYLTESAGWTDTYYYKNVTAKYYDRISKLKDALYTLATYPVDDLSTKDIKEGINPNVKIGIGTFPYYGASNDQNRRGYIRIAADKWGDLGSTQRNKVLTLIRRNDFVGRGGTPTSAAYAESAAYLLGTTTGGGSYSGQGLVSDPLIGTTSKYKSPLDFSAASAQCNGQGIYFLTDGQPQSYYQTNTTTLMAKALNKSSYSVTYDPNILSGANDAGDYISDWQAIASFSKSLNNAQNLQSFFNLTTPLVNGKGELVPVIKTAVVGFGSVFSGTYNSMNNDAKNAYQWGVTKAQDSARANYGKGSFTAASKSQQIVDSLNAFIGDVNEDLPSFSTGSSTIPADALNPEALQGFSYFPQFEPVVKEGTAQQVWFGNLKKYYVVNNSIYGDSTGTANAVVSSGGEVQDVMDIWGKGLTYTQILPIYKKGGVLSRLILGTSTIGTSITGRKLLTDYKYDKTQTPAEGRDFDLVRITSTYTTDANTKTDTTYARPLMAVLGYDIANGTNTDDGLDNTDTSEDLRQMGSILHSLPVLLTQQGKLAINPVKDINGNVVSTTTTSISREDYVLFGSAQGMVHVVDADSGVEKFTFLPKEMLQKQPETLLVDGGSYANGKNALYYGMDGEWVAHTVYVSDDNGMLKVKGAVRSVVGSATEKENLNGKQWVYGGMRMGGRSYYALDLTDIDNPKIKFHIDPATGKVYSKANPSGTSFSAIQNMGQSWSKPRIDYVNWKGKRKLVMFVGGGYDAGGADGDGLFDATTKVRTGYAGYEKFNYKQEESTSTKKSIGSGVYMFDADTGDLLWSAGSGTGVDLKNSDLKYSVVSEIKTIDRNSDGMVDHLYFGDLAGQAFRVDFKNDAKNSSSPFNAQVTKILNLYKSDGTSPRFYLSPVFTVHRSGDEVEGGNIVVATFVSGNKSSPLLATADSPTSTGQTNSNGLAYDAVYAIYDYDIYPNGANYPDLATSLKARTLATNTTPSNTTLKLITAVTRANGNTGAAVDTDITTTTDVGWGGWYYRFDHGIKNTASRSEGVVKGLMPLIAMDGSLYVTMYDASVAGTNQSCGAGVKGKSFAKRLCLPTGVCAEDAEHTYNLGAGIVSLQVGSVDGDPSSRTIIVSNKSEAYTNGDKSTCVGTACAAKGDYPKVPGGGSFIPKRWYEKYAKGE